ncbi:MAG: SUMF1/EgtB/PvdO family nonheme iron enzyme [Lysobacteraceae bacterium]
MTGKVVASARALALLCACGRDRAPAAPAKAPAATAPVEGLVTVRDEPGDAPRLAWRRPEVTIDPADVAAVRKRAAQALADGRLYEDADAAIPLALALRDRDPADAQALALLERALRRLRTDGEAALDDAGDDAEALQRAQAAAAVLRAVGADAGADGEAFLRKVEVAERLWTLNTEGEAELAAGRPGERGEGALARFREALTLSPGQARASQGVAAVESTLLRRAEDAATRMDFDEAERWLAQAATVRPGMDTVATGRGIVEDIRRYHIARLRDEGLMLLTEPHRPGHLEGARARLAQMLRIARPGDAAAAELRTRIDLAAHYGLMRPGQRFTDALQGGGRGPELIVVPHGGFRMGARTIEPDASDAERPQRYVRFERGFAIARTEVTVEQFRRFVQASGYRPRAVRRGHSLVYDDRAGNFVRRSGVDWRHDYLGKPAADTMPVVHVSAKDAAAYARWLSEQSGQHYRLPSEAEFEYALRSGLPGRYPWGDLPPTPGTGNLTGGDDHAPGGRSWGNAFVGYGDGWWGPAPVASFRPNAFGIHDLEGNVSEWVADCWHEGYRRAPTGGEAWINPGCRTRVIRGGAWGNAPAQTRAAWRRQAQSDATNALTGFRVVRDL